MDALGGGCGGLRSKTELLICISVIDTMQVCIHIFFLFPFLSALSQNIGKWRKSVFWPKGGGD